MFQKRLMRTEKWTSVSSCLGGGDGLEDGQTPGRWLARRPGRAAAAAVALGAPVGGDDGVRASDQGRAKRSRVCSNSGTLVRSLCVTIRVELKQE